MAVERKKESREHGRTGPRKLTRPGATKAFAMKLESPGNGNGDFYEVQLAAAGLPAPGR